MSNMELKIGQKILEQITDKDIVGPVYAVCDKPSWNKVKDKLGVSVAGTVFYKGPFKSRLDGLAEEAEGAKTILAIGNGAIINAARYVASKLDAGLVLIPTEINGEEIVKSDVFYLEEWVPVKTGDKKEADLIIVELGILWESKEEETRAGASDVLSIVASVGDCKKVFEEGKGEFSEGKAEEALDIVDAIMDWADDLYDLTEGGVKKLIETLQEREKFAENEGSRALIEGSPHIFAECAVSTLKKPFARSKLVSLGTVLMMELQGQNIKPLKQFMHWVQIPWKPEKIGITEQEIQNVIEAMPEYAEKQGYPITIVNFKRVNTLTIQRIIAAMNEPFVKSELQTRDNY
jgi:glycerol dehydrogenase-like iron-containing ADH family enzyme